MPPINCYRAELKSSLSPSTPFSFPPMLSPVSPTYSNFSAPSPYSEPSPISDPNYDSPVDHDFPVYPLPIYSPHHPDYSAEFDGSMMTWSPENKKHHLQPTVHHPFTYYHQSDVKDLGMLYIPPPIPPQRHPPVIHSPVPSHPIHSLQQQQQQPMQQHLPVQSNDVLFDVDLEDWSSAPNNSLHAQFPPNHSHTHTHSIALAHLPQYPANPAPRSKREELPAFTGYHNPSAAAAHYDLSGVPIQNHHDPSFVHHHHQQHHHAQPTNGAPAAAAYYSPPYATQQLSPTTNHHQVMSHQQQQQRPPSHHQPMQQQNYVQGGTVIPAELSPTSPSSSPLSSRYAELSHNNAVVGCDPRYVSGSHESDMLLKGMLLGACGDDGVPEAWNGERRCSLTSLESEADSVDRDAEGEIIDADADGDDDQWDHQHQQVVYDQQHQPPPQDVGEEEVPEDEDDFQSEDEKEDDYYEDDEESVDDDDNDGEFVLRTRTRRATASGAVYPASYPHTTEGRNLRSRASRYNPYPNYPGSSASDNGVVYSEDNRTSSRRHTASPPYPTRTLGRNGMNRLRSSSTTLPVPVPVPNLTKKSRGRRVPTVSSLEDLRSAASGAGKKRQTAGVSGKTARMYLCDVEGCGKCFARGEHLKRHVRSIHTYEKPHTCPYPGCGKDFSRHDNLGQHMRVHKDFVLPKNFELFKA